MQLKIAFALVLFTIAVSAQEKPIKILNEKEVNFLFNYYEQDGNHSPVTGGVGTEYLTCIAPLTLVHVPFDSIHTIDVGFGLDYYTSASCDNIDRFVTAASSKYLSSASSKDLRKHIDVSYSNMNYKKARSRGGFFAFSSEFDVQSFSIGYHQKRTFNKQNTDLGFKANLFYDQWLLIYPGEIRDGNTYRYGNDDDDYDNDSRITGTFSWSWSQVLTKKLQFILLSDIVYQNGILQTPFHRTYFDDGLQLVDPDTNWLLVAKTMFPETLPRSRFKVPLGLRVVYYLSDYFVLRFYYRFYFDDFGIRSHTANVEIPYKAKSWLMVYPFYRYYIQTASHYFQPFGMHQLNDQYQPVASYFTSDYDLSAFTMHKFGLGARISPIFGIHHWKLKEDKKLVFKYIDLKFANYRRSDGLKASTFSVDFGFVF